MRTANVGESMLRTNPLDESADSRSLGSLMIELMEPGAAMRGRDELSKPSKWKPAILDFLQRTKSFTATDLLEVQISSNVSELSLTT